MKIMQLVLLRCKQEILRLMNLFYPHELQSFYKYMFIF
jgi:hypothetical protein